MDSTDEIGCYSNQASNDSKRTLYVGNIGVEIDEALLLQIFSQFGQCLSCKLIRDINGRNEPYAFVEMASHNAALVALNAMNHITMMNRELRVNWATTPGQGNRQERIQQGSHVFVGDLPPDTTDDQLMEGFKPFGPIIECKVVRHSDGTSRGYAFVTFTNKDDAEKAIKKMDRSWFNSKTIRCNWATRKHPPEKKDNGNAGPQQPAQKNYDEVYAETSNANTTVYIGNISSGLSDDLIRSNFLEYGQIMDIKIFADKGYAFVRYDTHEAAAKAIVDKHGSSINGCTARCSWGKESSASAYDSSSSGYSYPPPYMPQQQQQQQQPYQQYPYDTSSQPPQNPDDYYRYCEQYYRNYYDQYQQQQQQQHYGGSDQGNRNSNWSYDYNQPSRGNDGSWGPPHGNGYNYNYPPPPNNGWNQHSAPYSWK